MAKKLISKIISNEAYPKKGLDGAQGPPGPSASIFPFINEYHYEGFFNTQNGSIIPFLSMVANGGVITTEAPENQPDINSTTLKPRFGQSSVRITSVANSRAAIQTAASLKFFNNVDLLFAITFSIVGGQINFVTDPTLQAVGYFNSLNVNNPSTGVYIRPPVIGEPNFYHYVVRVGGVEVLKTPTQATYDATNRKFVHVSIQYVGSADTIYFSINFDGNLYQDTLLNFVSTYPAFSTANLCFGAANIRNGTGSSMINRNLNVDEVLRYIKFNY